MRWQTATAHTAPDGRCALQVALTRNVNYSNEWSWVRHLQGVAPNRDLVPDRSTWKVMNRV